MARAMLSFMSREGSSLWPGQSGRDLQAPERLAPTRCGRVCKESQFAKKRRLFANLKIAVTPYPSSSRGVADRMFAIFGHSRAPAQARPPGTHARGHIQLGVERASESVQRMSVRAQTRADPFGGEFARKASLQKNGACLQT